MGKTAVFMTACLQQPDASETAGKTLVVDRTREHAYQIKHVFDRFAKYSAEVKTGVVLGGMPIAKDWGMWKDNCPPILISTPGRLLGHVFVLDESDKCVDKLDMPRGVQQFCSMMISAPMACMKSTPYSHKTRVDEESELMVHGLLQYCGKLTAMRKTASSTTSWMPWS